MYQTMSYENQLEMKAKQIQSLIDQAVKAGGQVDEQGNPDYVLRESKEAQENLLTGIKWNFLLEMNIKMVL